MANPAVTYTFSNSTTADATQVNQNFTDIINGLTDGTKDLSVSALTAAGTATFNGNVAIGNSSSDTLTITSVLSSSLALGTTFTYDVGSATVGLRSLYLGSNDAAAKSVRLIAGAVGTSYTLTLPTAVPTLSGQVVSYTTGGVGSFVDKNTLSVASPTTTYPITTSDEVVLASASGGAYSATLPNAVGVTGKVYTVKKTDSSVNAITIATTSSQTIDGVTTRTVTIQYESVTVVSDGSNWHII